MKAVNMISYILLFIGGLNWGLVGAFGYNLVEALLGDGSITRVVYILVGLSALYSLSMAKKIS
jgi:uncharacterized membrane protein YuzA (DUF378 family)